MQTRHTYTYTYTYTYTCTYTYTYTYTYTHTHTHTHTYTYTYRLTCPHAYLLICLLPRSLTRSLNYNYWQGCLHACVHAYLTTHPYITLHIYIHIHTRMHIHARNLYLGRLFEFQGGLPEPMHTEGLNHNSAYSLHCVWFLIWVTFEGP